MGAHRRRQALLRTAGIVAGALVLAAGVLAAMYWDSIGSKKKSGDTCSTQSECASGLICFEYTCVRSCKSDGRCPDGQSCVTVPVVVVTPGQADRGGGLSDVCVADADAPRYMKAYRDLFRQ